MELARRVLENVPHALQGAMRGVSAEVQDSGAHGDVYKVCSAATCIALKVPKPDEPMHAVLREAQLTEAVTAALRGSPAARNVAAYLATGGGGALALEYAGNHNASHVLVNGVNAGVIRDVVFQVVYALAVLQHRIPGFKHNDLKLANVVLRSAAHEARYPGAPGTYDWLLPAGAPRASLVDFALASGEPRAFRNPALSAAMAERNDKEDTHFFLAAVLQHAKRSMPEGWARTQIIKFVVDVIPVKYFAPSAAREPDSSRLTHAAARELAADPAALRPRAMLMHDFFVHRRASMRSK
jgi:serine/threonine protein kinase